MLKLKKTTCTFCSLGCGLIIRLDGEQPVDTDYDRENPVNRGSLCPRGHYVLEQLNSPARIPAPYVRMNRMLLASDFPATMKYVVERLKLISKEHGRGSIGVALSPALSNDDIYLAHAVFKKLGYENIAVAFQSEDFEMLSGDDQAVPVDVPVSDVKDLDSVGTLLIVGDLLERAPVMSQKINAVKYGARENRVIVIDPRASHTSWFATSHLKCIPGTEGVLLSGIIRAVLDERKGRATKLGQGFDDVEIAGMVGRTGVGEAQIRAVAKDLVASKKGAILLVSGFRDRLLVELSKILASSCPGKFSYSCFYSSGNARGSYIMSRAFMGRKSVSLPEMLSLASRGSLKAMLLFGVDPCRAFSNQKMSKIFSKLEMSVMADVYKTRSMDFANCILPLAVQQEAGGGFVFSGDRNVEMQTVVPPAQSVTVRQILQSIWEALEKKEPFQTQAAVAADVKKALKAHKAGGRFSTKRLKDGIEDMKAERRSKDYPYIVHLRDDVVHSGDGSVTSAHLWAAREAPSPYVEVNFADARELKIAEGSRVLVKTPKSQIVLHVKTTSVVPEGIVAMPHHFQEVRELVDMERAEGSEVLSPSQLKVAIEKVG